MSDHKFTVGEALGFGWNTFKANPGYFLKLMAVTAVIMLVSGWLFSDRGLAAGIIGFLVNQAVLIGLTRVSLLWADQAPERLELGALRRMYPPFRIYFRFVLTTVLASLAIGLGLVLLIIPGLIAMVMLSFCNYINIDRGARPVEALKLSAAATRGSRWQVFGLMIAFLILNIGGALLLLVGLLVTVPVTLCAMGYAYRKLVPAAPEAPAEPAAMI